jgi:hypothetical protein
MICCVHASPRRKRGGVQEGPVCPTLINLNSATCILLHTGINSDIIIGCKIWGSHGGDKEECLLGYKNPVHTSQETHYVPAAESSPLMLCKIWGFHASNYEECRLLGYKIPVHTSQETHYVSTAEPSRLMICKIWVFHGGDYEECHLLGYKIPIRTSQETHYVSATESSRLMLCKIWRFHGGDYEKCRLLECLAMLVFFELMFRRNVSPPSSV